MLLRNEVFHCYKHQLKINLLNEDHRIYFNNYSFFMVDYYYYYFYYYYCSNGHNSTYFLNYPSLEANGTMG